MSFFLFQTPLGSDQVFIAGGAVTFAASPHVPFLLLDPYPADISLLYILSSLNSATPNP